MRRACAWCGKELPPTPTPTPPAPDLPQDAVSHGICPQCREQLIGDAAQATEEVEADDLEEYAAELARRKAQAPAPADGQKPKDQAG